MIKNILIIFLIYIISSLLIANPNNIEIFNRTFLKTKKLVETGYDHIENKLKRSSSKILIIENEILEKKLSDSINSQNQFNLYSVLQ